MTISRQGTLKEESSDESTIISSQTSTLTRNMGPEAMMAHADSVEGVGVPALTPSEFSIDAITVQVENTDDDEEEDNEEDFMINENTVIN